MDIPLSKQEESKIDIHISEAQLDISIQKDKKKNSAIQVLVQQKR
jgi:hypothetical protein